MIQVQDLSVRLGQFSLKISVLLSPRTVCRAHGKTGSGKTTVLEAICGLRKVASGSIYLYEQDVTYLNPALRESALFLRMALFSTMSVYDHWRSPCASGNGKIRD